MDDASFEEFLESVREMKAIQRGEKKPACVWEYRKGDPPMRRQTYPELTEWEPITVPGSVKLFLG